MLNLKCCTSTPVHISHNSLKLHPVLRQHERHASRRLNTLLRPSAGSNPAGNTQDSTATSNVTPDVFSGGGTPPDRPHVRQTADDDKPPPFNIPVLLLLAAFVGGASWFFYEINRSLRFTAGSTGATESAGSSQAAVSVVDKRTVSDDILALKRLLREVFEKLLKLDERVTELEPTQNDPGVVIPALEGPKLVHVITRPDEGAAVLAQVQVHGCLQWGVFKPFVEGAAASIDSSELLQQVTGPVLRLIAHSLLAEEDACIIAAATVTQRGLATIDKVLLKAKLPGKARLLCSFLGGNIENVAPRLNPFTGYGVTETLRKGHGLEFIHDGGTGPAAAVSLGALALSGGYFVEGGPTLTSHSVAQATVKAEGLASCHFVLSRQAPWLRSEAPRIAADGAEQGGAEGAPAHGSLPVAAFCLPRPGRGRTRSLEEDSRIDGGIAGTVHIGEGLVLSGWSRWDMCEQALDSWGLGLCTQPDEGGHMVGLAVSKSVRQAGGAWMGELSAKIQTADGFTTSPSAVFYQLGAQKVFALGTQAEWRF